jgi:Probable zinc-ribbon domain
VREGLAEVKSNKQRREEIKARRRERAALLHRLDPYVPLPKLLLGTVAADAAQLAHNNTYGLLPLFYVDRAFACRDCGAHEVWTAKQQKWWYEVAKGNINSVAVRCRPCRAKERERVAEARVRAGHAPG